MRVTIGIEASASSFCGWCRRIHEIGVITSTTDATAITGRRTREEPPPADRAAAREPPRPPPPEAAAVFPPVGPDTAAVVVATPPIREPDVPVGADSASASVRDAKRRPVREPASTVEPAADCVTQEGDPPPAAARE
ncbi:hypothetical protein [Kribbella swartbergensis]